MELLQHKQLEALLDPTAGPCASVYMPTHRSGVETKQGPIRLKNRLKDVEKELARQNMRSSEIKSFLEPMLKLCENGGFWQYQSDGLALFRSPEAFHYYRLPLRFDELVVVTERFHVKPLLRLFTEDGRFYLLALSKKEIRLMQCTRYGVREIGLPDGAPDNLDDFLKQAGIQKQLQVHSAGGATKFHGHGSRGQDNKQELKEYFRAIDKGVRERLRDERAPLVLAGVDYLFPLYRESNTYSHLMEDGVPGNPVGRKPEELQSAAWGAVEPYFRRARMDAADRFGEMAGSGKTTSDVRKLLSAAAEGRVEQLFVAVGKQVWGKFDPESQKASVNDTKKPGDRDLLNFIAAQTLLHGGSVYAVPAGEVPNKKLLAAVFRY